MSARWSCVANDVPSGAALRTILQVAGAAQERVVPTSVAVTMDSVSATAAPVLVQLYHQTTAGTGGTTVTPGKVDGSSGTPTVTALRAPGAAWTAEPTLGDLCESWRVPPTSGTIVQLPLGDEYMSAVAGRLAVVVTAAATVNVTVTMRGKCE